MAELFVVYEGKNDVGLPNPAAAFSAEAPARESYNETLEHGLADLNTGLYLGHLSNLSDADVLDVYENVSDLADLEFSGYDLSVLDSFASDIADWDEDALNVGAEDVYDSENEFLVHLP